MFYFQRLRIPPYIKKQYPAKIDALSRHEFHGMNLEHIHFKNSGGNAEDGLGKQKLISARINDQNRFIFVLGQIHGEWELTFLCVTPHDYKKTIKKCKERLKQIGYVLPNTDDYEFIEVQPEALQLTKKNANERISDTPVTYVNHQWIAYTDSQFNFMTLTQMHLVLSGPPGSGKTLSMLGQLAERSMNPEEKITRVLWIAPTQNLVDETRAQWLQMAEQEHLSVCFMTYKNWVAQNRNPTTAAEMTPELFSKSLSEWLNQISNRKKAVVSKSFRKLLLDNVDAVRYELSLISVIGSNEYLNKGNRQSYFTAADERTVLAALFDYYQLFLADNQMIDPFTEEVQGWQEYDLVMIDEGQNLPPRSYANLRYPRTVIGLDSRQCIETAPYIESFITQDLLQGQGQKIHHLTGTYRCSEMVTELANNVLEVIDKVSPKARTTSYKSVVSSTGQKGHVRVYDKLQGDWTNELRELAQDPDTLVITNLNGSELEYVIKALDPQLLLTPGQSIGLTFKRVIFLSPLSGQEAGLIEKRLQSHDDSPLLFKERSYLNSTLVGLMRAADEVIVVQENVTNRSKLYQLFFSSFTKKIEPPKPQKEKEVVSQAKQQEKWLRNRDALLAIGDTKQAENITRKHLNKPEPVPVVVKPPSDVKVVNENPQPPASMPSSIVRVKPNKKKSNPASSRSQPSRAHENSLMAKIEVQTYEMLTRQGPFPNEQDLELVKHLKKFPDLLFRKKRETVFGDPFIDDLLMSQHEKLYFYLSRIPELFTRASELIKHKRAEFEARVLKNAAYSYSHKQTYDWLEGKNEWLYQVDAAKIQGMLDALSFWRNAESDTNEDIIALERDFYRDLCTQWVDNTRMMQSTANWAIFPDFNETGIARATEFFSTLKTLTDRLSIAKPSLDDRGIAYLLYIMLYDLTADAGLFSAAEMIEVGDKPAYYIILNRYRFAPYPQGLNHPSVIVIDIALGKVFDQQTLNQCPLLQLKGFTYKIECIGIPLKSVWDLCVGKILEHKTRLGFRRGQENRTASIVEAIEECGEPLSRVVELLTLSAKRINTVGYSIASDEEHLGALAKCSGALKQFDYLMKQVPDNQLSELVLAKNAPYVNLVHTLVTSEEGDHNGVAQYLSINKGRRGAPYYIVRAKIWLMGFLLSEQLVDNQPVLFGVVRRQGNWWKILFSEYKSNMYLKDYLDTYFRTRFKDYPLQTASTYFQMAAYLPELNMDLVGEMLAELAQHAETDFKIDFITRHLELRRFSSINHLLFNSELASVLLEQENHFLIVKMLQDPCWHNFVARLFAFNPEATRVIITAALLKNSELIKSLASTPYGLQLIIQATQKGDYNAINMSHFLEMFHVSKDLAVIDQNRNAMTIHYTKMAVNFMEQLYLIEQDENKLHRLVQPHVDSFGQFMGTLSCALVQAKQNNMHLNEEYRAYLFLFYMYVVKQSPLDEYYFPMTLIKTIKNEGYNYFIVKSHWLTAPLTESISYLLNPQCTVIDCSTGMSVSGQEFLKQHDWTLDNCQLPVEPVTPNIFFLELLHSAALSTDNVALKELVNRLGESTLKGLEKNLMRLIPAAGRVLQATNQNGFFTSPPVSNEQAETEQPNADCNIAKKHMFSME